MALPRHPFPMVLGFALSVPPERRHDEGRACLVAAAPRGPERGWALGSPSKDWRNDRCQSQEEPGL